MPGTEPGFVNVAAPDAGIGRGLRYEPPFEHRVTVAAPFASVLVAAPDPFLMWVPRGEVRVGDDGRVHHLPGLGRGASYTVRSFRRPDPAAARPPLEGSEAPETRALLSPYLQLPVADERIVDLAGRLMAGGAGPYDQAAAVAAWIEGNIAVTADPEPLAEAADAAATVLFDHRAGSPARVATATVVVLRAGGVPARLTQGFLPGRRNLVGREFVVRGGDAHVWVEAWAGALGWQTFDPTGALRRAEREDGLWARLRRLLAQLWPVLVAVAAAGLAFLAWQLVRRWRDRQARPWATRYFARVERAGAARGRPREPAETAAEYAAALGASVLPDPRMPEVGEVVTSAAYSGRPPGGEARDWAEQVLREVTQAHPRPRRRVRARPPEGAPR